MAVRRVRRWAAGVVALSTVAGAVVAAVALSGEPRDEVPRARAAATLSVVDRPLPRPSLSPAPPVSTAPPVAAPVGAPPAGPQGREARAPVQGPAAAAPAGTPEQRGREALATLDYPWQELGYDLRFAAHRGGHLLGLADSGARVLTVYVRDDQSVQSLRITIAHEIGHALDHVTGDEAQRARYREVRGLSPSTPWYPCSGCSDYASPAGDFAEVFAYAVAGPGDFRSRLGPPPSSAQLRELAPLFAPLSQRPRRAEPAAGEPSPSPTPSPTRSQLLPLVP